jgi:hypothetical protein
VPRLFEQHCLIRDRKRALSGKPQQTCTATSRSQNPRSGIPVLPPAALGAIPLLAGHASRDKFFALPFRGGRVIADWPGLKEADLYEKRDLKPTTDLRAVLRRPAPPRRARRGRRAARW